MRFTQGKAKSKRGWRRSLHVAAVLLLGAALGGVFGLALPVGSTPRFQVVDSNVQLPDPTESLRLAQAAAPYHLRLPSRLPGGATLEHVTWSVEEGNIVPVNMWFAFPEGGKLHIWQSNTPEPIQDIEGLSGGQATIIAGREWSQIAFSWGEESMLQLSTRFEDGVVLSIDVPSSKLDAQSLSEVAASLV